MLTTGEVAALLGVSARTVRHLASEGRLDRIKLGHRTIRYTRASVDALTAPTNARDPRPPSEGPARSSEQAAHHAAYTQT